MKTMQPKAPVELGQRPEPERLPAPRQRDSAADTTPTMLAPLLGTLVGVAMIAVIALVLGGQAGIAALMAGLLGQHSAWYLSRAAAFVSYILLWWSMVLGLAIMNRLARVWPGGPTATDLHEHASLLGIVFALLHGLVLLGDQYIGYTLPQILVPFAGAYAPLWVGLGQVGLYLMALVTFTFYIRQRIGTRAWRLVHYLSFGVFVLSLAHGLASGTDSGAAWAIWTYTSTGLSVLGLTIYRLWVRALPARPVAARLPAQPPAR